MIRNRYPSRIAEQLASVQPMDVPTNLAYTLRQVTAEELDRTKLPGSPWHDFVRGYFTYDENKREVYLDDNPENYLRLTKLTD